MLTSHPTKNIYSHFKYKGLTKINDEPNVDSKLVLHCQIPVLRVAARVHSGLHANEVPILALRLLHFRRTPLAYHGKRRSQNDRRSQEER